MIEAEGEGATETECLDVLEATGQASDDKSLSKAVAMPPDGGPPASRSWTAPSASRPGTTKTLALRTSARKSKDTSPVRSRGPVKKGSPSTTQTPVLSKSIVNKSIDCNELKIERERALIMKLDAEVRFIYVYYSLTRRQQGCMRPVPAKEHYIQVLLYYTKSKIY